MSQALAWVPEAEALIPSRDMLNGPANPFGFETFQTIDCDFVQPSKEDPIGGTTPKFMCAVDIDGKKVELKFKYDQQYNSVHTWGRPNPEVYTSVVSQRILWALGFGSDQSVPVSVNCRNCPIEPWFVTNFYSLLVVCFFPSFCGLIIELINFTYVTLGLISKLFRAMPRKT